MQKNSWWLIVSLIVVISAIILRLGTPSNRWVCERGEWVKKGNPSSSQPTKACFDEYSIEQELVSLSELFESNDISNEESEKEEEQLNDVKSEEILDPSKTPDSVENDAENFPRLVELISPQANEVIRSPYQVSGFARGTWYFEASFPVVLRASDGKILAQTYAQAQSDWMTEDLVPFASELIFDSGDYIEGELVIIKDNPSGLPEYDAQIVYPVRFISEIYED
jgi:hypothetical protein